GPTESSIVFVGPKRIETHHGKKNQAVNRYGNQSAICCSTVRMARRLLPTSPFAHLLTYQGHLLSQITRLIILQLIKFNF
ncbi:hypothetical protein, partial [Pseudescherichia sp.]|uniref:hypothetical protein n=1 Tax=Pseudescherichia sp. TaxID=2055881 RepID=UPI00289A2716